MQYSCSVIRISNQHPHLRCVEESLNDIKMMRLAIAVFVLSVMLAGIQSIIVSLAVIASNNHDYKDRLKFTFSVRCVNVTQTDRSVILQISW